MNPAKQKRIKSKVIVAMSGGVDSSVAAALLKKAGVDIVGVFMKFWSPTTGGGGLVGGWNKCCSPESEKRARKVAKILKIPFYVFNFEKEFKKRIVDKFLEDYRKGITPNPCVVCNKDIKFGLLMDKALALGADYITTGHYARIRKFVNSKKIVNLSPQARIKVLRAQRAGSYSLMAAKDKNKDQSYFLWKLNQNQLKHILFPIGNYTRAEVEEMAKKFKLPFSNVKKSMEICFIPDANLSEFLKSRIKANKGKIVDIEGKELGRHEGIHFYTIGQRKGIKLSGGPALAKASASKPYYVVDKDAKRNVLIVSRDKKTLFKKEIFVKDVNWLAGQEPKSPLKAQVKIRYRSPLSSAFISKLNAKRYTLVFTKSQRAVTPGQSAVFYLKDNLLGGGIIC